MKHYVAIRAFISYVATFKGAFWIIAAVFAVSNIILSLIPLIIGQLTISLTQPSGDLTFWTIMIILASIMHDAFWRCGEILYLKLLVARSHRFDDALFSAALKHDYSFFIDKFTGKISSYANSLGREFRELLDNFHYQYVNMIVSLPIITFTMFTVNVYTGVIFTLSLILMFIIGRKLAIIAAEAERKEADEQSTIDGYVVDAVANFVSVKAFNSSYHEARRLHERRHALIKAAESSFFKAILFWGSMSLFVRWIIWPSTFILNIYLFTQGVIDLAQMTTFLTAIVIFSNFIWEIVWNISQLTIKLARIEEAYRYLFGTKNVFKDSEDADVPALTEKTFQHSLELRNVSFAYPDKPDMPVLHDINLKLGRYEKVGIVGPSGDGKSTLIKLLLGYYPITNGELLIDGKPVDNRSLSKLTAYVPQDTAVFHRSIRENIAYAKQDAAQSEVIAAARHAHAHEFIMQLSNGYDTLVGERGIKLSGGQRQRIAIARALLKDAPLLMLDEATSALDSESEKLIQKALKDLLERRAALVIAHRLSTIQYMDRIVVFDNGTITEEGTHQELLSKNGMYASLWKHQSGGFIEE